MKFEMQQAFQIDQIPRRNQQKSNNLENKRLKNI